MFVKLGNMKIIYMSCHFHSSKGQKVTVQGNDWDLIFKLQEDGVGIVSL